jgi:hypothetical protein
MPSSASAAVTPQPTVPSPPTNIIAVPGGAQITVYWTPPISDGGSPIIEYTININVLNSLMSTSANFPASSKTILNLIVGEVYIISVSARNAIGSSISSTSVSATPFTPSISSQVTNIHVTYLSTDLYPTISWSPPISDGGSSITTYYINLLYGGSIISGSARSVTGSERSYIYNHTLLPLSSANTYVFSVRAQNSTGISSYAYALDGFTPR